MIAAKTNAMIMPRSPAIAWAGQDEQGREDARRRPVFSTLES